MNDQITVPYIGHVKMTDWRLLTIGVLLIIFVVLLFLTLGYINGAINGTNSVRVVMNFVMTLSMVGFAIYMLAVATKEYYNIQGDIEIAELLEEHGHYRLARDMYIEILEVHEGYRDLPERVNRLDEILGN